MRRRPTKSLIAALAVVGAWGPAAQAQEPPDGEPPDDGATTIIEPPPPENLTDEDLAKLSEGEAIEIFDERPDKPFDRDTEVRLTGEQLAARGATDLATALALIPDVTVRDAGRGGFNVDIRGGRKGAVSVMIDGVLVSDPYYGTFDVSSIPVTDIVQIRVATTPQSPIDGAGGPGGVIEVLTRDAIGPQLVIARITGDSLPSFGMTGTARVALAKKLALRVSASGLGGAREMDLPGAATIGDQRRSATGSARVEYRDGDRRVVVDGFLDDRHYLAPPNEDARANILMIDRETSARAQIKADDKFGKLQLQGQYFVHWMHRKSRRFDDPALMNEVAVEDLEALRSGGSLLATQPITKEWRWAASLSASRDKALVFDRDFNSQRGESNLVSGAGDLQFERNKLRVDGAVGIAIPFAIDGNAPNPWPEAKLVGKYKARPTLELTATTGYKGRVPSLRERFDVETGNPDLEPEKAFHAEIRAVEQRDRLRVEVAPFYRRTTGTVRSSTDPADNDMLVNLGDLDIYGIDTLARVLVHAKIEVGGSYNFIRAKSDTSDDPLDRLPHHRFDAWARVLANDSYSALARVRYFGAAIDQGGEVDGYALVEGNLTAQITKEYLAVLRVDDLLDTRPQTRTGYYLAGRVISIVLQGAWQ
ncbi:MAG: TonB-dependent receptor plug domain-containing protein [Kofleriaceae bacterium]